ncbi:hypothetical protein U0070_009560 [Myodes glareolus]|uniref:Kazal-like domain-containing protein n=1 Tax=Myodes glareolus TaxID=447135 RepID=A0AAW0IV17_MYOGA
MKNPKSSQDFLPCGKSKFLPSPSRSRKVSIKTDEDPKKPVHADETGPNAIVNGFSVSPHPECIIQSVNSISISVFSESEALNIMKPAGTVLLLIGLACLLLSADAVSQGGFQAFCRNYEKTLGADAKSCPKIHKPVCGTDGRTYQNRCEFCRTAINCKVSSTQISKPTTGKLEENQKPSLILETKNEDNPGEGGKPDERGGSLTPGKPGMFILQGQPGYSNQPGKPISGDQQGRPDVLKNPGMPSAWILQGKPGESNQKGTSRSSNKQEESGSRSQQGKPGSPNQKGKPVSPQNKDKPKSLSQKVKPTLPTNKGKPGSLESSSQQGKPGSSNQQWKPKPSNQQRKPRSLYKQEERKTEDNLSKDGTMRIKVQEGECPNRLDPQNPLYVEETGPSVIVNGFSERLRVSHSQRIRPNSESLAGEPSSVDTALQADLEVYGVGESPSSSSLGPCRGPESTHHSEGPLDGSWDGWREASRVEQVEQADLGVYGVGESPSSPSPGPCRGPNQLTTRKALWMEAGMADGKLAGWSQQGRLTWESMGSGKVLASPRRGPCRGPNQLTTREGPLDGSWDGWQEASRVEPAGQADLGVYGVGESPSSPSPGPLPWPESTHHSEGPLDGSWDGWREASRVEQAGQADLGVYGVGESPSSSLLGPCRGPESTHHSEGPLDGSWDGWREALRRPSGWKLGWLTGS